jgi:hypothetical protein
MHPGRHTVLAETRQQQFPPSGAMQQMHVCCRAMLRSPETHCHVLLCCAMPCCARPVAAEPKADPLGRNLNGTPQAELPPGFVDSEAEAAKARQGKLAAKLLRGFRMLHVRRLKCTRTVLVLSRASALHGLHLCDTHAGSCAGLPC